MTEFNSVQHNGALPAWMLPDAPDLTKWHWQAPRPDLWAPLPEPPESPKPPLVSVELPAEPPAELSVEPPEVLEAAPWKDVQPVLIDMEVQPWQDFLDQLTEIRKNHSNTVEEFGARFKTFVRRFKKALSKGKFTGPATASIYAEASWQLSVAHKKFHYVDYLELRRLNLYLMSATCSGIRSAKVLDRTFCITTPNFWEFMLMQLAKIEVSVETARVFTFIMQNLKPRNLKKSSELVVTALKSTFKLWKGATPHGEPEYWDQAEISSMSGMARMWSVRVEQLLEQIRSDLAENQLEAARFKLAIAERCVHRVGRFATKTASLMSNDQQITEVIADGLKDWKPRRYGLLFAKAALLLGTPRKYLTRAHYNWLQILVRMEYVSNRDFMRLLESFAPSGHVSLSHAELGYLMLLHWRARGMLQDMGWTLRLWKQIRVEKDHTVLAALALAVNRTNSPAACTHIFWSLWMVLKLRGGKFTFTRQVALLSRHEKLSIGFLKRLAWTSSDPRLALLLHDVLVRQTGIRHQFWWPEFWSKFANMTLTNTYLQAQINPIRMAHGLLGRKADRQPLEWMEQSASEARLRQQSTSKGLEQDYYQKLEAIESEPLNDQLLAYYPQGQTEQTQQWAQQIKRIKTGLQMLAQSPILSDSQALRHVSMLTNALAKKQGYLSARDLSTLSSVIIRVLNNGNTGPSDRLKHYLGLVYSHLGRDVCAEVGMIMKRRVDQNAQLWQRGVQAAIEKERIQLQSRRQYILWRACVGRNGRANRRLALRARQARGLLPISTSFRIPTGPELQFSENVKEAEATSFVVRPNQGGQASSEGNLDVLLAVSRDEKVVDRKVSF